MDAHSLLHWIVNIVLEVPAGVIRHERNERHEHEDENFSENMIDYVKNPKHTKELLELMKWIAGRSQDTRALKFHFYIPATNNWNMKFLKNDIYNRIKNQNTETSF